jgi:sucrose-phosphate synthase
MATLHHGVVVDPTDPDAVAAALLGILTHPQTWDDMSGSGVKNIMAYSWPSHCKKYLDSIEAEKRSIKGTRKHERTLSGLLGKRPALPGLTETAKEEHDSLASGMGHGGSEPLSRYFSTPQPMVKGEVEFASSAVAGGPLGPGSQSVRKTVSGVSNDDLAILQSLEVSELARGGETPPLAAGRHRLVVLPLDSDYVLPQATAALSALLERLRSEGQRGSVGVGLLSMLGFESTCEHLEAAGIGRDELDFMVCNSGADMWLQWPGGRWDADEAYEGQIGFEWDRIVLHRMLTKIISQPQADNKARRLPRLKELLYNVQEQPAAGVHPRHICLELDPETQAILSAGMGPRSRSTPTAARSLAVVDRLRRRLRSKGLRASFNLQMVPREQDYLAVLHITPLRASRPLALRYLAQRVGRPLDSWVVLALSPETAGSEEGGDLVAGSYCSDTSDLLGGLQKVCVVTPEAAEGGAALPHSGSLARSGLGVALQPFLQEGTGRLAVAPSGQAPEAVLQLVQQEEAARREEAKAEA